jgi:hypothetical protein
MQNLCRDSLGTRGHDHFQQCWLPVACVGLTSLVILSASVLQGQPSASTSSEHPVSVQPDVKLQVLDWGGTGRPLIFLSGLGDDAHVYDKFALKFTEKYHVYAINTERFWRLQQTRSYKRELQC